MYGYKAKQVRDNIHAYDVARFVWEFVKAPRRGEVYNLGGGKQNSVSMLEAFARIEAISGKKMNYVYSDLRKMKAHYPAWSITKTLDDIFTEIAESWGRRSR